VNKQEKTIKHSENSSTKENARDKRDKWAKIGKFFVKIVDFHVAK